MLLTSLISPSATVDTASVDAADAIMHTDIASSGIIARTASETYTPRTITGTSNQISVADGDGIAGNPTLSTPQDIHTTATPTFGSTTINGNITVTGTVEGRDIAADGTVLDTAILDGDFTQVDGYLHKVSAGVYENIKTKFDATTAPTVSNDWSEGYKVDSSWVDVTGDNAYACVDNTTANAVWKRTTNIKNNPGDTFAPSAGDDNTQGYEVHSLWKVNVLNWVYVCRDASTGAAAWDVINITDASQLTDTTNVLITAAERTKVGHLTVTQAVDLGTMESNISTNNAKITNATHTGDVTGSTTLTITNESVTNAKLAHIATGSVLGRTTASMGDVEAVDIDTALKTALNLVKADVGLGSVPNTDCTNASNLSTGTLLEALLPTINADNTTISNIEVDNLKVGVIDTDLTSVSADDSTLASAKSIKAYADSLPGSTNLSLTGSDLSIFTSGNNKIEITPNTGSNSESLELTGNATSGVHVGINTNHNNRALTAATKNGSSSYGVDESIASVVYDISDLYSGQYGAYGIYLGVNSLDGSGWIQTGRTDATLTYLNGDQFNLILQPNAGNVGIGATTVAASALLELSSDTGALLLTRMTTTQRDALTAVNGMVVYNTTTTAFNFYENGSWVTK